MSDKEMADFLRELSNRHEMPIDEDEYYLVGEIADRLEEQEAELLQQEAELDILRNIYEQESPNKQAVKWELDNEQCTPICKMIFDVPYYFCGDCKAMLNMYATKAKYCSACGKRIAWKGD